MFSGKVFVQGLSGTQANSKPYLSFYSKMALATLSGTFLAYSYTRYMVGKHAGVTSMEHLLKYESEDQINTLINQTKKPVVIYYYSTYHQYHSLFRRLMIKYSNLHNQDCHWMLVNIAKNYMKVTESIHYDAVYDLRLEIRFPKTDIQFTDSDSEEVIHTYRRENFNMTLNQNGFKSFLEHHAAIPCEEALADVLNATEKAIFKE